MNRRRSNKYRKEFLQLERYFKYYETEIKNIYRGKYNNFDNKKHVSK